MKLFKNEKGVSEIVGAMLILLIIVLYLGIMQAYEVPKWDKEIEKQAFDEVQKDFLDLRSDIEDSSVKNLPITTSMHARIRYPERFMLRNPGVGAQGMITTYPLRINITYDSNGTVHNENYTSVGFVYELKGLSVFPKLVNEHGMIIKDFGNWNDSDGVNHLTTENGVFIQILSDVEPIYSTEFETFNILPITQYIFTEAVSTMNVTLETRYPEVWAAMPPESKPAGSEYSVVNGEIRITNISGFDLRNLSFPVTSSLSGNYIHSGIIRFTDPNTVINTFSVNMTKNITNSIMNNITNITNITNTTITNIANTTITNITNTTITNITNTAIANITNNITNINTYNIDNSSCSFPGRFIWDLYQGCVNLPKSASINNFIIQDIKTAGSGSNNDFIFNVRDFRNRQFEVQISFNTNSDGDPVSMIVSQTKPFIGGCNPPLVGGQINLTPCYIAANIDSPNALKITHFDTNIILFVKFIVY